MVIKATRVDPITVAVLDSRFDGINDEMARVLMRTSRSTVFAEARDFAVSILDKDARLIAQREYQPVLAGANGIAVEHIAAAHKGNIHEGDIFIHNDSYSGNTHLGDLNIAKPIFYKSELMFWAIVKGHMTDTGNKGVAGSDPTSKTIWQDGVVIPPIKLYERGQLNTGVRDLYLRNLKMPDIVWGDIMCDVGAVTVAERSLLALLERYSPDTVYGAIDSILASSEAEMRKIIRQIPEGVYYGEKSIDHEPIFRDKPIKVKVKITVKGDELTIDFTGSDPPTPGYVNSTWAVTFSACHLIMNYFLPGAIRRNHGSLVPIKIINPAGTWLNPTFPAPVAKATTIPPQAIGEAIILALSKAIPRWITAGAGVMCNYLSSGFNPRTKRSYVDVDFFMAGYPSGGTEGYDGWDLGGPIFQLGALRIPDVEITELAKPAHILQYEQEPDSAGAGKFRSGFGHRYKVQSLVDTYPGAALVGIGMRDYVCASGLFGGKNSKPNTVVIHREKGGTENIDVGAFCDLHPGDVMECHLMGGGGFGDPFERNVERVHEDVKNRLVSVERAREDYGVVIDPVVCVVDLKATEELRKTHKR
ncbi:MAG: hydantoinase B/oxoprolinase family protein [Chloroflexi bacterium]|nr:hydantoinase B/oxoprolinase family protein [Chloroflexota bacterium]